MEYRVLRRFCSPLSLKRIDPAKTMKLAIRGLPEEVFQVTGIDTAGALKTQGSVTVVYVKQGGENVCRREPVLEQHQGKEKTMTINYVCLSDMHLGQDNSLLTNLVQADAALDHSDASPVLKALCKGLRELISLANAGTGVKPVLIKHLSAHDGSHVLDFSGQG